MRIFVSMLAAVLLVACSSEYGNKVTINKYSDVFYKGDGVKEDDARRLGQFLLKEGYFDTTSNKTVQLTKDSAWIVKLVVDEKKIDPSDADIQFSIRILEMLISEQVFNKEKTRLVLANDKMEEIKFARDTTSDSDVFDSTGDDNDTTSK